MSYPETPNPAPSPEADLQKVGAINALGERMMSGAQVNPSNEALHGDPLEFPPSGDTPRPYPEGHPARQFLESLIPKDLTRDQQNALDEIAGNAGQQDLVEQLREGYVSQTAREIDLAMLKSPLPRATVVFRAEGPRPTTPEDFPPGRSDPNPCYISTTLDEAVARSWLNTGTVTRIVLPEGTPVAVPDIGEAEILLPRESVLETQGAHSDFKPNGSPVTYVDKVLVPGSRAIDEARAAQTEIDIRAAQEAEYEQQRASLPPIDWQNPFG